MKIKSRRMDASSEALFKDWQQDVPKKPSKTNAESSTKNRDFLIISSLVDIETAIEQRRHSKVS